MAGGTPVWKQSSCRVLRCSTFGGFVIKSVTRGLEEGLETSAAREDGVIPVSTGPYKGQSLELSCKKLKHYRLRWSLII